MTDQRAAQNVLRHIDQGALVELAMSLIRIPSFIGEETPARPLDGEMTWRTVGGGYSGADLWTRRRVIWGGLY